MGSARVYVIEQDDPAPPRAGVHDQREPRVVSSPSWAGGRSSGGVVADDFCGVTYKHIVYVHYYHILHRWLGEGASFSRTLHEAALIEKHPSPLCLDYLVPRYSCLLRRVPGDQKLL